MTKHRQTITIEWDVDNGERWVCGSARSRRGDYFAVGDTFDPFQARVVTVVEAQPSEKVEKVFTRDDLTTHNGGLLTHKLMHFGPWRYLYTGDKVHLVSEGSMHAGTHTPSYVLGNLNSGIWKFVEEG